MTRRVWASVLWVTTGAWVLFLLLSLRYGFLNAFFYDTAHSRLNPAIDLFPVIRGFASLANGQSIFDTFLVPYGPYATWYLYHPALALVLGPWLVHLAPWTAFHIWTAVSIVLMGLSAWFLMRSGDDPIRRPLVCLLLLGSFPLLVMLRAGNVQSILVLALTLVLVSLEAIRQGRDTSRTQTLLLAGLLISLLSKPAVLLILPMLLCLQQTRRTAFKSIAIYFLVSALFLVVPGLNPVPLTWSERVHLATHPALVRETMDIYTNHFVVTPPMKDNSVHWLEMAAMTDFRLQNIDVYSLPVFLDGILGNRRTPAIWYRIPGILVVELSLLVLLLPNRRERFNAALPLIMATLLMFFLSFGIVWEYDYTVVFPIVAIILMRPTLTRPEWAIVSLSVFLWGPSLFFAVHETGQTSLQLSTWMRADRILPVAAIFCILLYTAAATIYREMEPIVLKRA